MARELRVEIVGDARSLNRALNSSQSTTKGFARNISNMGKVAVGVAGAAGIGALVYGLKAGVNEFKESQAAAAQTNAVLKSTGGVAGITAKHVKELSESIMKKTGIDDEAIQSSENLLLAFTKIRNEVGKGNDIFDRATKIVQDYSVRTGKSAAQASIAFGKALQDPVKGLGALSRAGIILTDSQKATLKSLVESGHQMQAQKFLLSELEKRYKGAAEAAGNTLAGQINIARESFNNWAGDMVAKLVPVLERVIAFLRKNWPQISQVIKQNWEQTIRPALAAFAAFVVTVVATIRQHWGTIGPIVRAAVAIVSAQIKIMTAILRTITALLRGDWSAAWQNAKAIVIGVVNVIRAQANLAKEGVLAALRGLARGIAALAGLFLSAAKSLGQAIVHGVVAGLSGLASAIAHAIESAISSALSHIHVPSVGSIAKKLVPHFAGGVSNFGGGLAVVGERGPELVNLPRGADVIPQASGRSLMGAGGGGSTTVQLVLPDGRMVAEWLIDPLKSAAAVRASRTGRPVFG